jgi:hypothetical protein
MTGPVDDRPSTPAEDLDPLTRAKELAEADLLDRPGVTGVDVGYKEVAGRRTDTLAIRVLVDRKRDDLGSAERVPTEIDGFPTDVIERRFTIHGLALQASALAVQPDAAWYPVVVGGVSIGPCRLVRNQAHAGSLASLVKDVATGKPFLLANFHVLCVDSRWSDGDPIAQPSRLDAALRADAATGVLRRAALGGAVDAAVAELGVRPADPSVLQIGSIAGTRAARLGEAVVKRGRTTRLTFGSIDSIHLTTSLDYGAGIGAVTLRNQLGVQADVIRNSVFAAPGDSGALVVGSDRHAVGMHVAGDDAGYGVANPIQAVLDAMQVELWPAGLPAWPDSPVQVAQQGGRPPAGWPFMGGPWFPSVGWWM